MPLSGSAEELGHWLRLQQAPGVGAVGARKLLAAFGLPQNIFCTEAADLRRLIGEPAVRWLTGPVPDALQTLLEKTLHWADQAGNHVLTLADKAYPRALLDIPDPPLMLYVKGRAELLDRPSIAVVGSRNATMQGCINAEKFSNALSATGLSIVSGLALGIDAAAHAGGLQGSGSTVAVVGTGADIIYPARNRSLAQNIAVHGCVVSEHPLGTPAVAANFPRRNRIISGLAKGVLVIEAAAQSGSLITARMAADQGRDVFAIPGSIHSPLSKGCHLLIKQGAKLVESAQDVLDELSFQHLPPVSQPKPGPQQLSPEQSALLESMGFDPVSPDLLAHACGLPMADVNVHLLQLELHGLVEMLPGGMTRRLATT